jgi:hypothetical protein
MEEMQGVPPVHRLLTKNIWECLGKVMRIERQRSDSDVNKTVEREGDQRLVKDRYQRLG